MIEHERLVRKIRDCLASGGGEEPVGHYAEELVSAYREVNRRLDMCESVIAEGSEHQAIQMAEASPNLLDTVAVLAFSELGEWVAYCRQQGLPEPEALNELAIRKVNALYEKGIDRNHPLYRAYRQEVRSRNNRKAFEVVNAIVRLNPADKDSAAERERLKLTVFREIEAELATALERGDRSAAIELTDRLAEHAAAADLELDSSATYLLAQDQIRTWRKADAEAEFVGLVDALGTVDSKADFAAFANLVEQAELIIAEFGLEPQASDGELLLQKRAELRARRAENANAANFRDEVSKLDAMVTGLETSQIERSSDPGELRDTREMLEKQWMAVQAYRLSVPGGMQDRAERAASRLDDRLSQIESIKRRNLTVSVAVMAVIVLVACLAAYSYWSARQYADNIADLAENGRIDEAHAVAVEAGSRPFLASVFPFLSTEIRETELEMERESDRRDSVVAQIDKLQAQASEAFSGIAFSDLRQSMIELQSGLETTSQEFQDGIGARVDSIRLAYSEQVERERALYQQKVAAALDATEPIISADADLSQPFDPADQERIARIEQALNALSEVTPAEAETELLPGEAQQVRLERAIKQGNAFLSDIRGMENAKAELLASTSFQGYRNRLEALIEIAVPDAEEIEPASRVLATVDSDDHFSQMLLLPGSGTAWGDAKSGSGVRPDEVTKAELQLILALRDDPMLAEVYSTTLIDDNAGSQKRRIFSRGDEPTVSSREAGGIRVESVTGDFYDPQKDAGPPVFKRKIYLSESGAARSKGQRVDADSASGLSPESLALADLRVEDIFNEDGTKYTQHLLTLWDRVMAMDDVSPVFKAYLIQQLSTVASMRSADWGLHFSPTAQKVIADVRKATADRTLRPADWMQIQEGHKDFAKFASVFEDSPSGKMSAEVRINHGLLEKALAAGVHFAGFVDIDGAVQLVDAKAQSYPLWGMTTDGEITNVTSSESGDAMPMSPVFYIALRPDETLRDVGIAQGVENLDSVRIISPVFLSNSAQADELVTSP